MGPESTRSVTRSHVSPLSGALESSDYPSTAGSRRSSLDPLFEVRQNMSPDCCRTLHRLIMWPTSGTARRPMSPAAAVASGRDRRDIPPPPPGPSAGLPAAGQPADALLVAETSCRRRRPSATGPPAAAADPEAGAAAAAAAACAAGRAAAAPAVSAAVAAAPPPCGPAAPSLRQTHTPLHRQLNRARAFVHAPTFQRC